jgi:hypothetical protein
MVIPADPAIPLWLKIAYTAFVAVLVPVYFKHWGPGNFLWFSDIALFGTLLALWIESSFLASMMTIAVLLPEVIWNVGFFGRLLTGKNTGSLSAYMFDSSKPLYVRALSLFHVFLPMLLVWLIHTLGYAAHAWMAQTLLAWIVLPMTYLLTDREENVNWVYGPTSKPQTVISERLYLLLVMLAFPLLVYLPTHLILRVIIG